MNPPQKFNSFRMQAAFEKEIAGEDSSKLFDFSRKTVKLQRFLHHLVKKAEYAQHFLSPCADWRNKKYICKKY